MIDYRGESGLGRSRCKYSCVFLSQTFRCVLWAVNNNGFVTKREVCTVKYPTEVIRMSTRPKSGPLEKNF